MLKKQHLLITVLSLCALIAGHSVYQIIKLEQQADTKPRKQQKINNDYDLIGKAGADFELPDLQQNIRPLSEWSGKTLIINFWATWCAPCREEIPDLINIQTELGADDIQVLGIAIDRQEMVYEFAQEYQINYPILHGEEKAMSIMEQYGNHIGALPYTIVLDAQGIIRFIHDRGVLTETSIKKMLAKLDRNLN